MNNEQPPAVQFFGALGCIMATIAAIFTTFIAIGTVAIFAVAAAS